MSRITNLRRLRLFGLVLLIAFGPLVSWGGEPESEGFTCGGPWGGLVFSLEVDPERAGVVLARTVAGSFLLAHEEQTEWRYVPRPGARWEPVHLAAGRLWCQAEDGRLRSSVDGGDWREEGDPAGRVEAIRRAGPDGRLLLGGIAPHGEDRILLFVAEWTAEGWRRIGTARFAHRRPAEAAAGFASLLVSKDGGAIRFFLGPGRSADESHRTFVLTTSDGGETWAASVIGHSLNAVEMDPDDPGRLKAAALTWEGEVPSPLLLSRNGGRTFKPAGGDHRIAGLRSLVRVPGTDRLLLGRRERGLVRTDLSGEDVADVGKGLPRAGISALAVEPSRPRTVWAATQLGVWRSDDAGATFRPVSRGLAGVQPVALLRLSEDRLGCFGFHEGLRISADGGRTWEDRAPVETRGMWSATALGGVLMVVTRRGKSAEVSRDGGRSFVKIDCATPPVGFGADGSVYRVAEERILGSRDGGEWRPFADVPAAARGRPFTVLRPTAAGEMVLAHPEGLMFLPAEGGATAVPIPAGKEIWTGMFPDPVRRDVVYVPAVDGTLFRVKISTREIRVVCRRPGAVVAGVADDPRDPARRYFAFGDGHFVVSEDHGVTVTPLKLPSRFGDVRGLAAVAGRLCVAADGAVHTIPLAEIR